MGREVDSPRTIPGGSAVPDGTVAQIFRKTDLVTPVASVAVAAGKYDHSYDGGYGPIETRVTYSGETRIRDSHATGQAGAAMISDYPEVMQVLGDGVNYKVGNRLQVTAGGTGRRVLIRDGQGMAGGITYRQYTDNKPSVEFAPNVSGQTRIDLIGFQTWTPGHAEEGRAELAILQGVPATSPVPATPTQDSTAGTWFEPLAAITLVNGYASITAGNIRDLRRYLGSPGLVKLGSGVYPFTAATELIVDTIFTADHRNYSLDINIDDASVDGTDLRLRLRQAGVTNVNSLYNWALDGRDDGNNGINAAGNNDTGFTLWNNLDPNGYAALAVTLYNPGRAVPTLFTVLGSAFINTDDARFWNSGGGHNIAQAFDGFRLYPASGTITGEVRVYGRGV